jgi:hypothetical protein
VIHILTTATSKSYIEKEEERRKKKERKKGRKKERKKERKEEGKEERGRKEGKKPRKQTKQIGKKYRYKCLTDLSIQVFFFLLLSFLHLLPCVYIVWSTSLLFSPILFF